MVVKDFMTGADNDLLIKGGDFVVDESDAMHIQDILTATPGTFKQSPLVGVGIKSQVEGDYSRKSLDELTKDITLQLRMDGYRESDVEILLTGNDIQTISVDAER